MASPATLGGDKDGTDPARAVAGVRSAGAAARTPGGLVEDDKSPSELLDAPRNADDASIEEIEEAAAIEAGVSDDHEYGEPGRPIDKRAPFYVGLVAAFGVAVALAGVYAIYSIRHLLLLLGLALFIAVGLNPVVQLLQRWVPRWAAVSLVLLGAFAIFAGFMALAVPVLVTEATNLAHKLPHYLSELTSPHTALGKLNKEYMLSSRLQKAVSSSGGALFSGILGVGKVILGVVTGILLVLVISIYLLVDLSRVKRGIYQLAPRSRRARVVLLTDEIFDRVGGYVLGNILISIVSGIGTYIWVLIFGVPFPLLLAALVALLDLVPIVGSTIGGLIVALVALTVSIPVAIATFAFYLVYRVAEDYLLTPRIMGRTVKVPGLVTVLAVIVGGALLGIIGALVAIPAAAAIKLLFDEVSVPRLDQT